MVPKIADGDSAFASQSRYSWYVVTILSAGYLVSLLDRFLMAVAMVPLKSAMGLTDTQLGLLHGFGFVLLYGLATPILGWLADNTHRRNLILFGMMVWTLATIACGLSDSFGSLFAARMIVGIGEAALVPAGMSLIMAYFVRGQVGRATSIFLMGGNIGAVSALVAGGLLLGHFTATGGWQLPFKHLAPWQALFVAGALPGLLVIVLMFTVREPARPAGDSNTKPLLATAREIWVEIRGKGQAYCAHTFYSTCSLILSNALAAWSTSFFVREHALSLTRAALIAGVFGACSGILGQLGGGWTLDRLRQQRTVCAPCVIISICLLLSIPAAALFALSPRLPWALVGFAVLYLLLQAATVPSYVGIQMLASPRNRGSIMGVFLAFVTLGSFGIGPAVIGMLSDNVFPGEHALGHAVATTVLVFAVLGAAVAMSSRKLFQREADQ